MRLLYRRRLFPPRDGQKSPPPIPNIHRSELDPLYMPDPDSERRATDDHENVLPELQFSAELGYPPSAPSLTRWCSKHSSAPRGQSFRNLLLRLRWRMPVRLIERQKASKQVNVRLTNLACNDSVRANQEMDNQESLLTGIFPEDESLSLGFRAADRAGDPSWGERGHEALQVAFVLRLHLKPSEKRLQQLLLAVSDLRTVTWLEDASSSGV